MVQLSQKIDQEQEAQSTRHLPVLTQKEQLNSIIIDKCGKPDYLTINLYWDTCRSWYNPKIGYTKNGNIYHITKLKTKGIYIDYKKLSKIHGCSREAIRQKLVKLEMLGLIHRSFQQKNTVTTKSFNKLIVYVWKETPHFYNKYGVNPEQVSLKPQTNHEYIAKKYKIQFAENSPQEQAGLTGGGIQPQLDTKELNNHSNKLECRSNAHARGANFSNVKNSDSQNSNTEIVETTLTVETPNTKPREETSSPNNVVRNGFLGGGKRLSEIQSYLSDELCEKLRSSSGKLFTNKAIREITKAIAVSEKGSKAIFKHINGVVSYLTPALANEKRNPNRIGAEGYYTLAGMTAEDKLRRKQEQFLESVEQTAMRQVCPEHQFKGKLVGTLGRHTAYNLLFAMKHIKLEQNTLVMSLNSHVELTEHQQRIILAQAQAVFNCTDLEGNSHHVEKVVFKTLATSRSTDRSDLTEREELQLPQGTWGKVAKSFIEEYGHDLYSHWLGDKIEAKEDSEKQTICLKASSDMVKDRIEQTYLPFLSKIGMNFGINKLEIVL